MRTKYEEMITKEKICCDMCGKEISNVSHLSVVIYQDGNVFAEYGPAFTHTGDWCESCSIQLRYLIEEALKEILVERYEVDHTGTNKTIEFYKKVLKEI